ncbi:metallophosphoesterase [Aureibacter tunicatorum]|uniref:Calcineurin-like phosphoesterase domain-containing protein n=1 Tax=Aureibacter tunicatorum TaxID=866807 RepID=A0AAE3XSC4_9BACT|nr:metallophosphoesterase [Aureibacter tunicatorum]MDR6241006.1 hypothetical protein [Aureibacter tunicatorum]BDD03784.1 hypothetical protein AUTU_12670 [Aureibacter tunicatorum]
MKRRRFIRNSIGATLGTGAMAGIYTWQIEPFWVEFVRVKMPIRNLPSELEGKTLMQISDVHVGDRFDYQYIIDSFEEAKKFKPEFVAYTGDFVSYENEKQIGQLEEVMKHAVLGKYGTVGVLGNHDYGDNWAEQDVADAITSVLGGAGIQILSNTKQQFNGLNFIGFDDYWGLNFSPQFAMENYDDKQANIVLCHNPDVCDLDVWEDYDGWILSGHTHGGQCKPPFLNPPLLPVVNKNYTSGKIDLSNGRSLYINRAIGHLWQVRFNVRPEVTIFELQKA